MLTTCWYQLNDLKISDKCKLHKRVSKKIHEPLFSHTGGKETLYRQHGHRSLWHDNQTCKRSGRRGEELAGEVISVSMLVTQHLHQCRKSFIDQRNRPLLPKWWWMVISKKFLKKKIPSTYSFKISMYWSQNSFQYELNEKAKEFKSLFINWGSDHNTSFDVLRK